MDAPRISGCWWPPIGHPESGPPEGVPCTIEITLDSDEFGDDVSFCAVDASGQPFQLCAVPRASLIEVIPHLLSPPSPN